MLASATIAASLAVTLAMSVLVALPISAIIPCFLTDISAVIANAIVVFVDKIVTAFIA